MTEDTEKTKESNSHEPKTSEPSSKENENKTKPDPRLRDLIPLKEDMDKVQHMIDEEQESKSG
jgi:hypothetical protein